MKNLQQNIQIEFSLLALFFFAYFADNFNYK
jgi:hypothetical protein